VDHFRVLDHLGEGGMGEVYLAEDTQLRRKVALKIIRPGLLREHGSVRRLLREARTTARFSHPNIVTIHHVGTHGEVPYLALEYLDSGNLRRRAAERALELGEVVRIGLAVAEALQEAHRHGVLHRDLKPENVMMSGDGRPRVVDFGLAGAHVPLAAPGEIDDAHDTEASLVTHHDSLRGTPAYMAPEQWRGDACSEATDIWSLGVLLFELIAGHRPFQEGDMTSLRARVLDERPAPRLERVPSALSELCEVCLDKRPGHRPSAAQVVATLRRVAATEAIPAGRPLGYLLVLGGLLFIFAGLSLTLTVTSDCIDGTSEASDLLVILLFGVIPLGVGSLSLQRGLRRQPGGLFLMLLGGLVATCGGLMAVVFAHGLAESRPGDPLAFDLLGLCCLGLLPLVGGALLLVRGRRSRARRRAIAVPTAPATPPTERLGETKSTVPHRRV
jgi:tRNA A-37 threonylcarbamoyl transferase component Bud32